MRFIFILCFLFSFNVLAQKITQGNTLAYVNIEFEYLSSVDSSLSKEKNGLVDKLVLNGPGRGTFWTKESSVRTLRDIKKDFRSKSITINFSAAGDYLKKYSDQIAKCQQYSQGYFYQNQKVRMFVAVIWRNDDLEKVYKSNKDLPVTVTVAPDFGFDCSNGQE